MKPAGGLKRHIAWHPRGVGEEIKCYIITPYLTVLQILSPNARCGLSVGEAYTCRWVFLVSYNLLFLNVQKMHSSTEWSSVKMTYLHVHVCIKAELEPHVTALKCVCCLHFKIMWIVVLHRVTLTFKPHVLSLMDLEINQLSNQFFLLHIQEASWSVWFVNDVKC